MTGSSGKRPVSEREQQLWKTITDNVKPLFKNGKSGSGKTEPKQKASQAESQSSFPSKKPSIKSLSPPLDKEKVFCERGTSKTAGIDRRTTNRLRRGQLPIAGTGLLHRKSCPREKAVSSGDYRQGRTGWCGERVAWLGRAARGGAELAQRSGQP